MSDPAALDMTLPVATAPAPGALSRLVRRPLALLGLGLVATVVAGALFAPWLTPYDPSEQFFDGLSLEGAPLPTNVHSTGSVPTYLAATCSHASSTAPVRRWSSVSSPMAWRC